jgi:hypothetical protein
MTSTSESLVLSVLRQNPELSRSEAEKWVNDMFDDPIFDEAPDDAPVNALTWAEAESQYRDYLDMEGPEVNIGGLYYAQSVAMERVDPAAFRAGFNDWVASHDIELI